MARQKYAWVERVMEELLDESSEACKEYMESLKGETLIEISEIGMIIDDLKQVANSLKEKQD